MSFGRRRENGKRRRPREVVRDQAVAPLISCLLLHFFWPHSHRILSNTPESAFRAVWNGVTRSTRARNRGVNPSLPRSFSQPRTSSIKPFSPSFSSSSLTLPFSSPTTTTALKDSCLPPVQTLVTRETWTTRSWNSGASADPSRRPRPPPSPRPLPPLRPPPRPPPRPPRRPPAGTMPSASSEAASTISAAEARATTEAKRALSPLKLRRNGADGAAAVADDVDALEAVGAGLAAARPTRDARMTPAISCSRGRKVEATSESACLGEPIHSRLSEKASKRKSEDTKYSKRRGKGKKKTR